MSKTIELKPTKSKKKKPNYDKFFENVLTDCSNIILDAMLSSEKGDNLNFKITLKNEDKDKESHEVQIIINKK